MGLNRGYKGLQPCPKCHVPSNELHNLRGSWPLRTSIETQQLIQIGRSMNASGREALLKANGIRDVDVCYSFCTNPS
jgi:hypothetical protein